MLLPDLLPIALLRKENQKKRCSKREAELMQLKECASLELFSLSCIGFRVAIKDLNILSIHHTLYINLEVIQFICSFAS